jgi:hypothetical protein
MTKLIRCVLLVFLVFFGLGLGSTKAFAGYYWWKYSTNGFMNANWLPDDGTPETQYALHYNYGYRPVTNQAHADTLVVFLPGVPARTDGYEDFYINAVNQGYFVMGLDYINDHGLTELCTSNLNCAGLYAQQTVMGNPNGFFRKYFDFGGQVPGMSGYNSITNRFGYWLKWLIATDPSGAAQWQQFCSAWGAVGECITPNWSKIIVASHSNGGALAWWILKNKGAKKAILLSAPSGRMNTANVTPASSEYTDFTTNPNPGDTHYAMYDNGTNYIGKVRAFLNFFDSRYKPGETVPGEPTSTNPNWVPNKGKNQPGNLVDLLGNIEKRVQPDSVCDTTGWTHWLTVTEPGDNGATHNSTASDGAGWPNTAPGWRECVWNFMLEH